MTRLSTRVDRDQRTTRRFVVLLLIALMPTLGACDPIWSISGAFFPAWLLCMVAGVIAAVLIRAAIARVGLEPHIGPRLLMYLMLYIACTCTTWLIFFAS